jgi:hypothetical protein
MNLHKLTSEILANGGATYSLAYGEIKRGYVVSPYKDREQPVPVSEFGPNEVRNFVTENADLLSLADHYLGAWIEAGLVYLDVCRGFSSKQKAMRLGKANGQKAIFDLTNGKTIYL